MASGKLSRNFTKGIMNKSFDERLVPDGQYIDAVNVSVGDGSTNNSGVVKPVVGNTKLTTLVTPDLVSISSNAVCVGSIADSDSGYLYWLIHDPSYTHLSKLDMIVGADVRNNANIKYVVVSNAFLAEETILKFDPNRKITAINIVDGVMYFTDGVNQPRQIILSKTYDSNTAEADLLVIKAPPLAAPTIQPDYTVKSESFMRDKTYCFAYRYKYSNGQYSATSQFTLPAFYPGAFGLDDDDATNTGMVNTATGVNITYNSGPKNVSEIELLFKYADSSAIYVINKINKVKNGINDNESKTFLFSEEKYVSVLPDYEILRLYDNVPFKADAQTYMGNRLMYWSYSDGFDLIDKFGYPVNIDFSATSESSTSDRNVGYVKANAVYNLGTTGLRSDSVLNVDMSSVALRPGTVVTIQVNMKHGTYAVINNPTIPTFPTGTITVSFSLSIKGSYSSVYQFATSDEFKLAIGTPQNINTDLSDKSLGTFTDVFNSVMPDDLGVLTKTASGIDTINQPARIIATQGSNIVGIQMPAMQYLDTGQDYLIWYLQIDSAEIIVRDSLYNTSLKSNRSYQIGMVYMDEYGRSTPAVISQGSSFFIDAGKSANKNVAKVMIPPTQRAPEWAHKFKFAIRESAGSYEIIYSSFFFKDPSTKFAYFLLSGENARKVKEDDSLVVKSDSYGAVKSLVEAQIIEKKDQEEDFIAIAGKVVPAGTYIKLAADGLNVTDSRTFSPGKKTEVTDTSLIDVNNYFVCPLLSYPLYDSTNASVAIPEGSVIKLNISSNREGVGGCEKRSYSLDRTFRASRNYDDFMRFWEGEGIANILNTGTSIVGDAAAAPLLCVYKPGTLTNSVYSPYTAAQVAANIDTWKAENAEANNVFFFMEDAGKLTLNMLGVTMCPGVLYENSRRSLVSIDIQMYLSGVTSFVFETKAADVDNGIFYEGSQSFSIDRTTGEHLGNVSDQNFAAGTPCVITLSDFNCISFGNGVESFKIKDSISGRRFYLGNRAYATTYTDVKRIDRFADGTWSGVYNDDTNTDKLNQFVSGLLNYKHLEESFGRVTVAFGRGTDVLILQENKISYVLAGKNLLSDSVEGGSIASVPEVLGTQIARIEEFGTVNPESFCAFAQSVFFADQRRGAVIRIDGQAYTNDKLTVISDNYMTQWFRDKMETNEGKIILGGYDPHNGEYVLSFTGLSKPVVAETGECGDTEAVVVNQNDTSFTKRYYIGRGAGTVNLFYYVQSADGTVKITATGMGSPIEVEDGDRDTIVLTVTDPQQEWIEVTIYDPEETAFVQFNVGCLVPDTKKVIAFVLTSNDDAGKAASVFFNYVGGNYISPIQSTAFTVIEATDSFVVSAKATYSGTVGDAAIPPTDATMTVGATGTTAGGFENAGPGNIFVYASEDDAMQIFDLMDVAVPLTISSNGIDGKSGDFIVGSESVIYVIYDFRTITPMQMSRSLIESVPCCDVREGLYINAKTLDKATAVFDDGDITGLHPFEEGYFSDGTTIIRTDKYKRLSIGTCPGCNLECDEQLDVVDAEPGIYEFKINTNGNTGYIPINIKINDYADSVIGVLAFNSDDGREVSRVFSVEWAFSESSIYNKPVFIGKEAVGVCEVAASYSLPVFTLANGTFVGTSTEDITVEAGQIQTQASIAVNGYWLGIPASESGNRFVKIRIYALCGLTSFTVTPSCGQVLPAIPVKKTTEPDPCDETGIDDVKYFYSFAQSTYPDQGDLMFDDASGFSASADGNYRTGPGYLSVQSGIIDSPTACTPISLPDGFMSSLSPVMPSEACEAVFNTVYYNDPIVGTDGAPAIGDVIYIDSAYSVKLVRTGGSPAGTYKYSTGYITVDASSTVTAVSLTCPVLLSQVLATSVYSTPAEAMAGAYFDAFFDGEGESPIVGDTMYLDSFGAQKMADYQGAGYIYFPATGEVAHITINSIIDAIAT